MAEMTPLKKLRLAAGLTQREVASKLDVTTSAYSNWEVGVRRPSAGVYPKLAKIFHKTTAELVELISQMSMRDVPEAAMSR